MLGFLPLLLSLAIIFYQYNRTAEFFLYYHHGTTLIIIILFTINKYPTIILTAY